MVLVPWGSIIHWVGEEEDRRDKRLEAAPCRVIVPKMVWVSAAPKVKVPVELTILDKLLKMVEPVICWEVPFKLTVPEL